MLERIFPFLQWWPRVNAQSLRADILAGLTGAVIVLPQGVAFAMIAGLPPEYGLYTAMVTPVIAALFGCSWHLISGPTTAISIVVFAAISKYATPGSPEFIELALVLTFLAGLYQLAMGLARLGTLVNFVSHTVVIGFTAGAAVLIATSQVKYILGIEIAQGLSFFETWRELFTHLGASNPWVILVALVTLFATILGKRWIPKWPYMILAMAIGSGLSILLGGTASGITYVQEIPSRFPPFLIPSLSYDNVSTLAVDAFAIALLGLIEAVAIARAIATHTHQRIDGNQEFIGQGLSNLVGSLFSSYAGSGSFTRSGINHTAGAQTPMAAIFAALFLAMILLLVAPLTAYLPIPSMGGIILFVAYNLIDLDHLKEIVKVSKSEMVVLLVTFFSTLFLELEYAIYLGVIASLIFYLYQTSRPKVGSTPSLLHRTHVQEWEIPGLADASTLQVVKVEGSLYFGAVAHVSEQMDLLSAKEKPYTLIDASGIHFIDISGAELLVQERRRWRNLGGDLYLCELNETVRAFLEKGDFVELLGRENVFGEREAAIEELEGRLGNWELV